MSENKPPLELSGTHTVHDFGQRQREAEGSELLATIAEAKRELAELLATLERLQQSIAQFLSLLEGSPLADDLETVIDRATQNPSAARRIKAMLRSERRETGL